MSSSTQCWQPRCTDIEEPIRTEAGHYMAFELQGSSFQGSCSHPQPCYLADGCFQSSHMPCRLPRVSLQPAAAENCNSSSTPTSSHRLCTHTELLSVWLWAQEWSGAESATVWAMVSGQKLVGVWETVLWEMVLGRLLGSMVQHFLFHTQHRLSGPQSDPGRCNSP